MNSLIINTYRCSTSKCCYKNHNQALSRFLQQILHHIHMYPQLFTHQDTPYISKWHAISPVYSSNEPCPLRASPSATGHELIISSGSAVTKNICAGMNERAQVYLCWYVAVWALKRVCVAVCAKLKQNTNKQGLSISSIVGCTYKLSRSISSLLQVAYFDYK